MDASASEWSSGCESGWTVYLDQSSQSPNQYQKGSTRRSGHDHKYKANYDQEEDLSMVSDASSGPPNFHYQEEEEVNCFQKDGFYCPPSMEKATKKKAKEPRGEHKRHSYLDDTASSPEFSCPKKYTDPSNNQPALGHGVGQGNFEFWQSSHPKRQDSAEPSLACFVEGEEGDCKNEW